MGCFRKNEHRMCHRSVRRSENIKIQVPAGAANAQSVGLVTVLTPRVGAHRASRAFSCAMLCLVFSLPMSSKPKPAEQSFEKAMDRLEAIVEQMESGKLPLEDLVVRYEEGMNLVKVCQERLASAEQKIEIIARNSAGKTFVKNFEPTQQEAAQTESAEPSENKNDEVRLF